MAFTKAIAVFSLSVLLLSCLAVSDDVADSDPVSFTQAPTQNAPSYPPAESPKHHHHHHHHHNKAQSPSHPPVHSPGQHTTVKPPVHAPSHSPAHAPSVKPPVHAAPSHSPAHAPSHAPAHAPSHAPVHAPSHSPVPAPSYPLPKRRLVAVQGVVYCKPCKYSGIDTLLGATPLSGASVRLQCNNTKYPLTQQAKTDKNGYFFLMAPKTITTFGSHKCKVFLASSPLANCNKTTNLHYGQLGAILMPPKLPPKTLPHPTPYQIFTVGPFAFESTKKC